MTSQIVEEQTDLIEKRMEDFDRKFPDLGVIVGLDNDGNKVNYKTTDVVKSWIRSFASTLIERERERLKSIFDNALKSANDGDDVVNAMSEALAPSTKLQEMK